MNGKTWEIVPYEGRTSFKKVRIRDHLRVRAIVKHLRAHDYVVLLGPPRNDKTWLLRDVAEELKREGLSHPVYIDLWQIRSDDETACFTSIAQVMSRLPGVACRPPQELLTGARDFQYYLERCLRGQGQHLTLLIDHLHALPNDLVHSLLKALRSLYTERSIEDWPQLSVVVTGGTSLADFSTGPTSPFNIAKSVLVTPLSQEQSRALAERTLSEHGRSASVGALERILQWTAGDYYLTPLLCTWSAQAVRGYRRPTVTSQVVDRAAQRLKLAEEAQVTTRRAIQIIEEDPETLLDVLAILEHGELPRNQARQVPTRTGATRLQLCGAVEMVGGTYRLKNETYRRSLAFHFKPAQVAQVLRLNGRWRDAIEYLAPQLTTTPVEEARVDLLEAIVQSIYAADDLYEAYEALAEGMRLGFGLDGITVFRADPVHSRLLRVLPQSDGSELPTVIRLEDRESVEARTFQDGGYALRRTAEAERLVAALVPEQRPIGLVTVERYRVVDPDQRRELPAELPSLMRFLGHAASAIESVIVRTVYSEIGRAVLSVDEPDTSLRQVLQAVTNAVGCDFATLYLIDSSGRWVEMVAGVGRLWNQTWRAMARFELSGSHATARCLQHLEPVVARESGQLTEPRIVHRFGLHNHLRVFVPLLAGGSKLGVLEVGYPLSLKFQLSEEDQRNLAAFADQVAIAVYNMQLLRRTDEALAQRVDELEKLREVSLAVSSTLDLGAVLSRVLQNVQALLQATDSTVWEYHPEYQNLTVLQTSIDDALYRAQKLPLASITGQAIQAQEAQPVRDLQQVEMPLASTRARQLGVRSMLTMPLISRGEVLGAINVHRKTTQPFDSSDENLLFAFATQAAVAIENARQYQDLIETRRRLDAMREQEVFDMAYALLHRVSRVGDVPFQLQQVRKQAALHGDLEEPLRHVEHRFDSLMGLLQPLKDLVELAQMTTEWVDIRTVVQEAVQNSTPACHDQMVRLRQQPEGPVWVNANRPFLRDALQSVVENACEATSGQGTVELSVAQQPDRRSVLIKVSDDGLGIPEDIGDRIFQPGFSTKTVDGQSRGRGLFTCRAILRKHRGSIDFDTEVGKGTTFCITLPTVDEAQS
jgi:signal transduction histidine kinase